VQVGRDYPGNVFQAIQDLARRLQERGVVLAVNSQNNEEDAWGPFRTRPEMRLERRHLAAWRINWTDKAANLRALSEELRLGLDAFVMLDNDPVQRAWVEDRLPEVHVLEAQDPLEMLQALATQRLFDGLGQTAEDARRGDSYLAAARRRAEEGSAPDRETFLASLGLSVAVGRARPEQLPRLAQLAQRTNQFNLTTKRYTEGQIRDLCAAPDAVVLYCACRDRFADEGVVGLAILRGAGAAWTVDTFLLSCRVLAWGVEKALAAAACQIAAAAGATSLEGRYVASAKNGIAEGFYRDLGFSACEPGDGAARWRLSLPAAVRLLPPWFALALDEDAR
jgi:FkbH-like protein